MQTNVRNTNTLTHHYTTNTARTRKIRRRRRAFSTQFIPASKFSRWKMRPIDTKQFFFVSQREEIPSAQHPAHAHTTERDERWRRQQGIKFFFLKKRDKFKRQKKMIFYFFFGWDSTPRTIFLRFASVFVEKLNETAADGIRFGRTRRTKIHTKIYTQTLCVLSCSLSWETDLLIGCVCKCIAIVLCMWMWVKSADACVCLCCTM